MTTIDLIMDLKGYIKKWLTFLSKPFIRFIMLIITGVVIFAGCSLIYKVNPSTTPLTPPCSLRYLTGLYCPGCGMTRALHAAFHLRFAEAFSYNLLWPLIVIFISVVLYIWVFLLVTGKNPFTRFDELFKNRSSILYIVIVLFFAFWILRNIPIYPFTLLAP
ncbi:MAG: DUF2752 domain-containing protein [Clostridiaceae bacterium]|jgi:hypothetical protein|nr:DUF2752 domain-containing protein [Clostridiaceae bacterium]